MNEVSRAAELLRWARDKLGAEKRCSRSFAAFRRSFSSSPPSRSAFRGLRHRGISNAEFYEQRSKMSSKFANRKKPRKIGGDDEDEGGEQGGPFYANFKSLFFLLKRGDGAIFAN